MKENVYIKALEALLIKLYDNKELSEHMLRSIIKELDDCYIDPEQTTGAETYDGKKFKEVICFTMLPLTHQEIMETSRRIDNNCGDIWENLQKAEGLFEYIWYSDFDMPVSEDDADSRFINSIE